MQHWLISVLACGSYERLIATLVDAMFSGRLMWPERDTQHDYHNDSCGVTYRSLSVVFHRGTHIRTGNYYATIRASAGTTSGRRGASRSSSPTARGRYGTLAGLCCLFARCFVSSCTLYTCHSAISLPLETIDVQFCALMAAAESHPHRPARAHHLKDDLLHLARVPQGGAPRQGRGMGAVAASAG